MLKGHQLLLIKYFSYNNNSEDIQIDDAPPTPPHLPYDINKAKQVMGECERHVIFAKLDRVRGTIDLKEEEQDDDDEDWSEKIQKYLLKKLFKLNY